MARPSRAAAMSTHDPARRLLLRRIAAAALATSAGRIAAQPAGAPPLRLGLVPYLSARTMLALYEPLRQHLQRALARPVQLFTAASFRALADNARAGEYDLAMLPAHIARVAALDWQHPVVARLALPSAVQVLSLGSTRLELPEGLRGRRIAAVDPLSIATLILKRWLVERGLAPDREVTLVFHRTLASAIIALQRGEADAVVGAPGQFRDAEAELSVTLQVVATLAAIPAPFFVAHRAIASEEVQRWRDALVAFVPPSPGPGAAGSPIVAAGLRDLDAVAPLTDEVRRLLAQPK